VNSFWLIAETQAEGQNLIDRRRWFIQHIRSYLHMWRPQTPSANWGYTMQYWHSIVAENKT